MTTKGSNVCLASFFHPARAASFAATLGLLLASTLSVSGNLCCIRNVTKLGCKYWGKTGFPKYGPPSCEGKVKVWTGPKQYGCDPCCAGTWQEECATCSCSMCNPLTEYESVAPTFRTDRKCSPCANLQCPTGKYRTGSCDSSTKGYACTPCSNTKCAKNQYRAGVCSGTQNDYSCNTHKPCPSNTYYVPSDDTHRTCPVCPAGQHQPKTSHRSVECIPITTTSTITSTSTTATTSTRYTPTTTTTPTATPTTITSSTITTTTTTASTTTTTTSTTTTTMDAAAYKAQEIEIATLKEALVGMSAAELLSKGFTVQELYDGGFAAAEIDAAGEDGAEFQVPETYDAQYSTLMASLNPDDEPSPVGAIVGAVLAIIVALAAGILIGRCNSADDAGDGVFSKCMGAGRSNTDAPINARISSLTINPSYPQSPSAAAPPQMSGPTQQTQPTLLLDGAYEEVVTSGTSANLRAAESLYGDGDGADEFSVAASAVASQSVYESPSSRQMQVYDDGEVPRAADHFAGGAYAPIGNDRKAYGSISATSSATYADIDGPYDEVGDERPYDEIDDDDIEL